MHQVNSTCRADDYLRIKLRSILHMYVCKPGTYLRSASSAHRNQCILSAFFEATEGIAINCLTLAPLGNSGLLDIA